MKAILTVLLIPLTCFALIYPCSATPSIPSTPPKQINISDLPVLLIIGDSLTLSLGPVNLEGECHRAGWNPFINAYPGRGLFREDGGTELIPDAFSALPVYSAALERAQAIVLALGSNPTEQSDEIFGQKIGAFIDLLRSKAASPDVPILWMNMYVPKAMESARARNGMLARAAQEKGFTIIDWYTYNLNNTVTWEDGIHNDTAGYKQRLSLLINELTRVTAPQRSSQQ